MDMLLGRGLSSFYRGLLLALIVLIGGCIRGPSILAPNQQQVIDRSIVEYPPGYELKTFVEHLTAPSAIAFDPDAFAGKGAILIAESGIGGKDTKIFGYTKGTHDYYDKYFEIYPRDIRIPSFGLIRPAFMVKGPIGGMTVAQGKIFVTHRDFDDKGVVTAFDYDGNHKTIASDFPCLGEYSLTDIIVKGNRVYFGQGAATNSGVVGPDDWEIGWVKKHPRFCDQSYYTLKLNGYRFDAKNPRAGLFGGDDIARTAPFLPFGVSDLSWVPPAPDQRPTAAIYSANVAGGDVHVEATGVRLPRGLAVDEWGGGRIYFTNDGMELRGTRPVRDDKDALLRLVTGAWYGWPDFSADLQSIGQERYQPPPELMRGTGYREIYNLIDHTASNPPKGLQNPEIDRAGLLQATFPSLCGAGKMTFIPNTGPFKSMSGNLLVTLSGDRAPFATSGVKNFTGSPGYRVVMVNIDTEKGKVTDFVKNTGGKPASKLGRKDIIALERPVDVKFGPDGSAYILDMGPMEVKNGHENVPRFGGRIFILTPERSATTEPAK